MRGRKNIYLFISLGVLAALGVAAYGLRDDISQRFLYLNPCISVGCAYSDAELTRLTVKLSHYYNESADEVALRQLIQHAMEDAESARELSDAVYMAWERNLLEKPRYEELSRAVATCWMLRAAEMGDPVARLALELNNGALYPVEGFHDAAAAEKAFAELEAKANPGVRECAVLKACCEAGVGVPADPAKAAGYAKKLEALQQQPRQ